MSSRPTAPTSAGRSRPAWSSASTPWRHGPPSCRGSRCEAPDRAIGRDTVSAIQSGAVLGHQALTAGLLARIRAELAATTGIAPRDVKAILTGGLSQAPWVAALEGIDAVDPDLTLRGLAILHAEVAGGEPIELGLG